MQHRRQPGAAADWLKRVSAGTIESSIGMVHHCLPQAGWAVEEGPLEHLARGIDSGATIVVAPDTNAVKVFQREPDRIHQSMTACTIWVCPVLLQPSTH